MLRCPKCDAHLSPSLPAAPAGNEVFRGTCTFCQHTFQFVAADREKTMAAPPASSISFTLNGQTVTVPQPSTTMTLNEFIRTQAGLTGTKVMCAEGGCGSCVVAITSAKGVTQSANSCLRLLCSVDGQSVTTIEALGGNGQPYHPATQAIAAHNGTQCGACTSGFVMEYYALSHDAAPTAQGVETAFDGHICRCTGYRGILDAFQSLVPTDVEDMHLVKQIPCAQLPCGTACAAKDAARSAVARGCSSVTKQPVTPARALAITEPNQPTWLTVTTLPDLYAALAAYASQAVRMVVGNTGAGVFKNEPVDVYINIAGIPDLTAASFAPGSGLTVGAAVTLTDLIGLLTANAGQSPSYGALAAHISKIANHPVRNMASWAGNIMLAHNHADFPSDMVTILGAAGAIIAVGSQQGVAQFGVAAVLQLNMTGRVVLSVTIPPLQAGELFTTYKVMPRHSNSHAYVNFGGRMAVSSSGVVLAAPTLVFGGVGSTALWAPLTAAALVGQNISLAATVQAAALSLSKELIPDAPPVAASVAYRLGLAVNLLYKFFIFSAPNVAPAVKSAAVPFVRPVSSGVVSFDDDPSTFPVSAPVPNVTALLQASGEAVYCNDIPASQKTLFAAFVMATGPPATLTAINVPADLPGVVAVFTAADVPGKNLFYGSMVGSGETLFVPIGSVTQYDGEPVALVVATTQVLANAAAQLVTVVTSNAKTANVSLQAGIAAKNFLPCPLPPVQQGEDITKALAASDYTIQGTVEMGDQYHMYMETISANVELTESGGLHITATTQWTDNCVRAAADVTGLPAGKIRCTTQRVGGGFGGKITSSAPIAAAAAMAATLLHAPVRLSLPLSTNMRLVGMRNNVLINYNVGFSKAGLLTAVKLDYFLNAGRSVTDGVGTASMMLTACDAAYHCPNWLVTPNLVQTDTPTRTACRAPGVVPAMFAVEVFMDHVAAAGNFDPAALRRLNLAQENQVTPYGQTLTYCSLTSLWDSFISSENFVAKHQAVAAFNTSNRWRKQGIAIQPTKYGIGQGGAFYGVHLCVQAYDGSVMVSSGGTDMGQGLNTKLTQAVAYALGVDVSIVFVQATDSFVTPNSMCSGGSITSEMCVAAALDACTILKQRMTPTRAAMMAEHDGAAPSWPELVDKCYADAIMLTTQGWYAPPAGAQPFTFGYNSYGMSTAVVELDVLTGELQVLSVDILYDCGQSINPLIDAGQIQGAFTMMLGYHFTERVLWDPVTTALLTNNTWEYKPPLSDDIPISFNVALLKNAPNPLGVLRSKAVGEPPCTMASVVYLALRNAVAQARATAGITGLFVLPSPATVESTQLACLVTPAQFVL